MAKFKITKKTTVAELKEQFRKEIGGVLRVYEGRSQAPADATLVSLGAKEGELECRTSRTVGKFIEAFQKDLNLKVKVYPKDENVSVLDGITLATVKDIPNMSTHAKMEEYLSYQRNEKEDPENVAKEDRNIEYGNTSEGMRSFCKDDKWGFEDKDGNIVIPPKYLNVGYFQNGLCPVSNDDDLEGLIDKQGCIVVDMNYLKIDELIDNRRRFQAENYKFGFLNENGKVVIEPIYSDACEFGDGLCGVKIGDMPYDMWGFIDVNGNMVIEPQFTGTNYNSFKDGLCEVESGDYDLTIDKTGKVLKKEKNPWA